MLNNLDKFSLPEIEKQILKFWKEKDIFNKTEEKNKDKKSFVFYEGPPTANGKPGIHHVLSRSFKDIMLRYKTMNGFSVTRKGGWDTHGLPVELEVEKKLGLKTKKDIEKFGIAKFNKHCKESVWAYKDEWERLTERMGYWLDMEDPYITYKNSYIETLWWIISQAEERGLLYKAHKVVPWCTRCGTTLSSHELAQGYKNVKEPSVYVKFKLKNRQKAGKISLGNNAYILSWTTTPWTLPGNVALAVGEKINYIVAKEEETGDQYIIAEKLKDILDFDYKIIKKLKGRDLVNLKYEPIFNLDIRGLKGSSSTAFKVYSADFVNTEEGTGIVHTAVMYGEDDYKLGQEVDLPKIHIVDESGNFVKGIPGLSGKYVKDPATEGNIFGALKKNNAFFKKRSYEHEYPFCWRCDTHVIYYARDSWFIEMSKLKNKMIKSNDSVNWTPSHIKNGRFGEWLKGLKDWAISRERYWGTPLPVWECKKCDKRKVISSMQELSDLQKKSSNNFFLMRHGESTSNTTETVSSKLKTSEKFNLTEKGIKQVKESIKELKKKKIDLIYASDFARTKQTAEIIGKELGIKVKFDKRIRENDTGIFDGRSYKEYHDFFSSFKDKLNKRPPNGENLRDVSKRVGDFILDLEKQNKDKNILIVSHEYPLWIAETIMSGWGEEEAINIKKSDDNLFSLAKLKKVDYKYLPRNEWNIADLHKPYIDKVSFKCECGEEMERVEEVMDVWFDSGSMPFAQAHYPFEVESSAKKPKPEKYINFPAEYITEGIDQTRGWFYTLLSVATILGFKAPYKNVISLELVLDKNGKKMSKSKGNTVNPWEAADKFGMDTIRWFFYAANSPGEPKRFDEKELNKYLRNFIFTLYNSFVFLNTYKENKINLSKYKSENIIDKWIISRFEETKEKSNKLLEKYNITKASRELGSLVDDLSRWHIRRSRGRLQNPDTNKEFKEATQTLAFVLLETSKLIAPFTPFISESLYLSLSRVVTGYDFKESVHLEDWPKNNKKLIDNNLMENMKLLRSLATEGLAERQREGIKVRQPLSLLEISTEYKELTKNKKLLNILKEEVNVKSIRTNKKLEKEKVILNTRINKKLKEEGTTREFIRLIQQSRREANLEPKDEIELGLKTSKDLISIINKNKKLLKNKAKVISFKEKSLKNFDFEKDTKLEEHEIEITLRKL
ncbi:MAG: class I tRNA ligase family protein [Candidatus Paceibacterota bacterium]